MSFIYLSGLRLELEQAGLPTTGVQEEGQSASSGFGVVLVSGRRPEVSVKTPMDSDPRSAGLKGDGR